MSTLFRSPPSIVRGTPVGHLRGALGVESAIHDAVNAERARAGACVLGWDERLTRAARAHGRRMADERFFSHTSTVPGLVTPLDRARAEGGEYRGVGENIAMHPLGQASAAEFVSGWMASPGHRANLLDPSWTVSGVGVVTGDDGLVYATQLFAIPSPVRIANVTLAAEPLTWYVVRIEARIGRGHALAAFVRNELVAAADADARGRASLEAEVPATAGRHHVSFGRRKSGSASGWIGCYEGIAEIALDGDAVWRPLGEPHSGCAVESDALYRVCGSMLVTALDVEADVEAIVVGDGVVAERIPAGTRRRVSLSYRGSSGIHRVDVGVPEDGDHYRVHRSFLVDTDQGTLEETD